MTGHNVSHSNIKTKRRFLPSLRQTALQSEALGQSFRLRISNAALRTLDFRGGHDAFLVKARDEDLSPRALRIKRQLKALAKPVRKDQLDAALQRWVGEPGAGVPKAASDATVPAVGPIPEPATPPVAQTADTAGAGDERPAIDVTVIDLIRDMERRGATRLLERLISTYLTTAARLVAQAAYALKSGDIPSLQHAAHTLKSSSANLGAIELSRRFAALERHARGGVLEAARGEWCESEREYERAIAALREIAAADEAVMTN